MPCRLIVNEGADQPLNQVTDSGRLGTIVVEVRRATFDRSVCDYSSSEEGFSDDVSESGMDIDEQPLSSKRRPSLNLESSEGDPENLGEQKTDGPLEIAETHIKGKAISHKAG